MPHIRNHPNFNTLQSISMLLKKDFNESKLKLLILALVILVGILAITLVISLAELIAVRTESNSTNSVLPTNVEEWVNTVGGITVSAGFIFLILEYRNALKQRQEDKAEQIRQDRIRKEQEKIQHDEALQQCNDQYYDILNKLMDDSTLEEFYDGMEIGDYKYWKKIDGDSKKEKIYNFAERVYYLCGRVHYLQAMGRIDPSSGQWEEWDEWIKLLITSEMFRGVHFDSNHPTQTDFGKHVDYLIKKLAQEKNLVFEKPFDEYVAKIKNSCMCKACTRTHKEIRVDL